MPKPNTGIVNIHGKEYRTVAYRTELFRKDHPRGSIVTKLISPPESDVIVFSVSIMDEEGRVLGTGHASEIVGSTNINRTSALENSETSAVGRALAFAGYPGDEIASADEVARAVSGAKQARTRKTKDPEIQAQVEQILAWNDEGNQVEIARMMVGLDRDAKGAVWTALPQDVKEEITRAAKNDKSRETA